jgi:parallel beta-helix repeat protein
MMNTDLYAGRRRLVAVCVAAPYLWLQSSQFGAALAQSASTAVSGGLGIDGLPEFSPLDFGAKGNGIADDTAACNAAAARAQAAEGVLVFPPGVFAISGYIVIRNGVKVVLGRGGVIRCINTKHEAGLLLAGRAAGNAENVKNCRVEGLRIDCNYTADGARTLAIYGQNVSRCAIVGNRIENLGNGYGILLRVFEHGHEDAVDNVIRGNEIIADTSEVAGRWGIGVDATTTRGADAAAIWRSAFRPIDVKHAPRSHLIEGNTITGGYYGIAIGSARDCVIQKNRVRMNMRNVSMQNGCTGNVVKDNDCSDSISSGIHLAYGSSSNQVVGNRIRTTRAKGEGLLQAYVGSHGNLFEGNTVEAIAPAKPTYFLYTGVHADNNRFVNNRLSGRAARAYIAVESAFNPKSGEPTHYNHLQGGAGYFAARGMSGIEVRGNVVFVESNAPVIVLSQVSDDKGVYPLSDCVVADNIVRLVPPDGRTLRTAIYLKLVEDSAGALRRVRLDRNQFPPGANAAQFVLPRGAAHLLSWSDNSGAGRP